MTAEHYRPGAYRFGQGTEITVRTVLPPPQAWAAVTDWTRHAAGVPLTTMTVIRRGAAAGVGDELRAVTGVGPLRLVDTMLVQEWQPPAGAEPGIAVLVKTGTVVLGGASIEVAALGRGSLVTWWEEAMPAPRWLRSATGFLHEPVTRLVFGAAVRRQLAEAERGGDSPA
ncbi:MAG: Immediate-early protein 2 [Micrococcales bacterium]|nr:MAG: Immediate-early protein 2 [Micrococcales bacterium]PIE26139.1 MAG: Immediate-early protein 2 [Micrococcales bacterium]